MTAPSKVADRGNTFNTTLQTSLPITITNPTLVTVGNYMIVRLSIVNSGTSGVAPTLSVADSRSNTWTVLGPATNTASGVANAGSSGYIAYAKVTTGYQAADTITLTFGTSSSGKAVVIEEWTGINATTPEAVGVVLANGAGTAVTISITPTAADQLVYCHLAVEGPTADTMFTDGDTTNGSWVALTRVSSTNATALSNQTTNGAYKAVTAAGAQTWDGTITSTDWAALAVVFAPVAVATKAPPPRPAAIRHLLVR